MRREPNFIYLLIGIILFLLIGPVAEEFFGQADSLVLMVACLLHRACNKATDTPMRISDHTRCAEKLISCVEHLQPNPHDCEVSH